MPSFEELREELDSSKILIPDSNLAPRDPSQGKYLMSSLPFLNANFVTDIYTDAGFKVTLLPRTAFEYQNRVGGYPLIIDDQDLLDKGLQSGRTGDLLYLMDTEWRTDRVANGTAQASKLKQGDKLLDGLESAVRSLGDTTYFYAHMDTAIEVDPSYLETVLYALGDPILDEDGNKTREKEVFSFTIGQYIAFKQSRKNKEQREEFKKWKLSSQGDPFERLYRTEDLISAIISTQAEGIAQVPSGKQEKVFKKKNKDDVTKISGLLYEAIDVTPQNMEESALQLDEQVIDLVPYLASLEQYWSIPLTNENNPYFDQMTSSERDRYIINSGIWKLIKQVLMPNVENDEDIEDNEAVRFDNNIQRIKIDPEGSSEYRNGVGLDAFFAYMPIVPILDTNQMVEGVNTVSQLFYDNLAAWCDRFVSEYIVERQPTVVFDYDKITDLFENRLEVNNRYFTLDWNGSPLKLKNHECLMYIVKRHLLRNNVKVVIYNLPDKLFKSDSYQSLRQADLTRFTQNQMGKSVQTIQPTSLKATKMAGMFCILGGQMGFMVGDLPSWMKDSWGNESIYDMKQSKVWEYFFDANGNPIPLYEWIDKEVFEREIDGELYPNVRAIRFAMNDDGTPNTRTINSIEQGLLNSVETLQNLYAGPAKNIKSSAGTETIVPDSPFQAPYWLWEEYNAENKLVRKARDMIVNIETSGSDEVEGQLDDIAYFNELAKEFRFLDLAATLDLGSVRAKYEQELKQEEGKGKDRDQAVINALLKEINAVKSVQTLVGQPQSMEDRIVAIQKVINTLSVSLSEEGTMGQTMVMLESKLTGKEQELQEFALKNQANLDAADPDATAQYQVLSDDVELLKEELEIAQADQGILRSMYSTLADKGLAALPLPKPPNGKMPTLVAIVVNEDGSYYTLKHSRGQFRTINSYPMLFPGDAFSPFNLQMGAAFKYTKSGTKIVEIALDHFGNTRAATRIENISDKKEQAQQAITEIANELRRKGMSKVAAQFTNGNMGEKIAIASQVLGKTFKFLYLDQMKEYIRMTPTLARYNKRVLSELKESTTFPTVKLKKTTNDKGEEYFTIVTAPVERWDGEVVRTPVLVNKDRSEITLLQYERDMFDEAVRIQEHVRNQLKKQSGEEVDAFTECIVSPSLDKFNMDFSDSEQGALRRFQDLKNLKEDAYLKRKIEMEKRERDRRIVAGELVEEEIDEVQSRLEREFNMQEYREQEARRKSTKQTFNDSVYQMILNSYRNYTVLRESGTVAPLGYLFGMLELLAVPTRGVTVRGVKYKSSIDTELVGITTRTDRKVSTDLEEYQKINQPFGKFVFDTYTSPRGWPYIQYPENTADNSLRQYDSALQQIYSILSEDRKPKKIGLTDMALRRQEDKRLEKIGKKRPERFDVLFATVEWVYLAYVLPNDFNQPSIFDERLTPPINCNIPSDLWRDLAIVFRSLKLPTQYLGRGIAKFFEMLCTMPLGKFLDETGFEQVINDASVENANRVLDRLELITPDSSLADKNLRQTAIAMFDYLEDRGLSIEDVYSYDAYVNVDDLKRVTAMDILNESSDDDVEIQLDPDNIQTVLNVGKTRAAVYEYVLRENIDAEDPFTTVFQPIPFFNLVKAHVLAQIQPFSNSMNVLLDQLFTSAIIEYNKPTVSTESDDDDIDA
jgi:hypothetical protein